MNETQQNPQLTAIDKKLDTVAGILIIMLFFQFIAFAGFIFALFQLGIMKI